MPSSRYSKARIVDRRRAADGGGQKERLLSPSHSRTNQNLVWPQYVGCLVRCGAGPAFAPPPTPSPIFATPIRSVIRRRSVGLEIYQWRTGHPSPSWWRTLRMAMRLVIRYFARQLSGFLHKFEFASRPSELTGYQRSTSDLLIQKQTKLTSFDIFVIHSRGLIARRHRRAMFGDLRRCSVQDQPETESSQCHTWCVSGGIED